MDLQSVFKIISLQSEVNTPEEELTKRCDTLASGDGFIQLTSLYEDKDWFNALAISGALFNGLFSLCIWYTKKLNVHPMRLLMLISISESIWCYSLFMLRNLCTWKLDLLFLYTTFMENTTENRLLALGILYWMNILIEEISVFMTVYLNIYLVLDFVMTLRYPFKAKK